MLIRSRPPRPRLMSDGGGGGGGGQQPPPDDRQNLQSLLDRHKGDALAVVSTLLAENHSLRDERRQLRGRVAPEGATVLTAEQAQQWAAYQQLGAPAELQTQLTAAQGATSELATLRREALLGQVEQASGYKGAVLSKLPGADKLTFDVRDVTVDGKAAKAVFVKDAEGKEHPIDAYAQATWADFLPALKAAPAPAPAPGAPFVPQNPGGGAPPTDPVAAAAQRFQAQRDSAPNPLKKA